MSDTPYIYGIIICMSRTVRNPIPPLSILANASYAVLIILSLACIALNIFALLTFSASPMFFCCAAPEAPIEAPLVAAVSPS